MKLIYVIFACTTVAMASAASNRNYCRTMSIADVASAAGSQVLAAYTSGFSDHHHSEIVEFLSGGTGINLIRDEACGIYPGQQTQVDTGTFCSGGTLFMADMNGDSRHDLLCQSTAGAFTYRIYGTGNTFSSTVITIPDFTCTTAVMIGDFDGNSVDDIMCFDITQTVIGAESSIFFSPKCPSHMSHHHHGPWNNIYADHGHGHGHGHKRYGYHKHITPGCDPITYQFPAAAVACAVNADDVFVADVNGDGNDDLVCHEAAGTIKHFLSAGTNTGAVFGAAISAAGSVTCAPFADKMIITPDVDGDGDDDLVCVNNQADATANIYGVSFYSAGSYQMFVNPTATNCIENVCHDGVATSPVSYEVGDFNNDGYEDYMCRYEDGTGAGIVNIVFSGPLA